LFIIWLRLVDLVGRASGRLLHYEPFPAGFFQPKDHIPVSLDARLSSI
jgi:hypothetical protein